MATATLAETDVTGALVPLPFRVSERRQDTADTWTLVLEPLAQGFAAEPGQFAMVHAFGVGEVPISLSGPPVRAGDAVVLTVRAVGAVTQAICRTGPGSVLGLRGPLGNSWPVAAAAGGDVVVVAGGIGLAPLRGAVLHVLEHRERYGSVCVLYGARTPADLLYTEELARWRASLDVELTVDAAGPAWQGRVGVVPQLVGRAPFDAEEATAFVCGPEVMMHFTVEALRARGVPDPRIMLSLERDMRCGVGLCGHCQLGPTLVCRDGPVYTQADVGGLLEVREL
ncbi:MAG TPA: FAD/NAD(P)-binding protein [Gaiellaceae bacterium]|jgi:NAD(P)H-flavin reductase|nr:FAD/NAD(P)-binding protein [Gaiellaceae bacterium]